MYVSQIKSNTFASSRPSISVTSPPILKQAPTPPAAPTAQKPHQQQA